MVFVQLIFNKKHYKIQLKSVATIFIYRFVFMIHMHIDVCVTSFTNIISIKGSCSEYNVHVLFLLICNQRLRYVSFCAFLGGGGM